MSNTKPNKAVAVNKQYSIGDLNTILALKEAGIGAFSTNEVAFVVVVEVEVAVPVVEHN